MRLLFITQDFPPDIGGIQTYASEIAPRLASWTKDFVVVAPKRPKSDQIDAQFTFAVHRLLARPDLLVLPATVALPRIARRTRADVAFHAQWQTVPASLFARKLTGYPKKIVVAAHGRELLFNPYEAEPFHGTYERARRNTMRRVDRFVAVSRYTASLLEDLHVQPERIEVVNSGTDPAYFRPLDAGELKNRLQLEGQRVLLTVARLVERKGVDTTLRALPRVIASVPDLTYLIVGQGPDQSRLEMLAKELGVSANVRFVGRVPYAELPLYYNACDAFVMPSRNEPPDVEGFGVVFLEANACNKPVIGAYSGGIPDAIIEGETGLLVPPNDPDALATAILKLVGNQEYAKRLGEQGRESVLRRGHWDYVAGGAYDVLKRACMGNA
jgi:phosphatidylinositol alpha-1,6-mannosyltransferase